MAAPKRKADTSDAPRSLEEQLAETKATVDRLNVMERDVVAAVIAAEEKSPGSPTQNEETATINRVAQLLLAGVEVLEKPSDADRSLSLNLRLTAIRKALHHARNRLAILLSDRQDEVEQEFLPAWRAHLAKVVALVDAAHELARERHALIARWTEKTGFRPQPIGAAEADEIVGLTDPYAPDRIAAGTPCAEFLEAAKRAGIR